MSLSSVHSTALSGMQGAMQRLAGASRSIASAGAGPFQQLAADSLARDVVAQRVALYEFKSNMQVFKTEQEMLGTLIDLRA
jgi:hypothetical protein